MTTDPWFAPLAALLMNPPTEPLSSDPELLALLTAQQQPPSSYAPSGVEVVSVDVPGPHGPIPVRVYGSTQLPAPVLVWCHGGGWAGGDLDMPEADATAREVALRAGAVVVSVDYRLCVFGLHYPLPLDDVVTAFTWAAAQPWADGRPVSLGGASAGANLAAGAALRLRDEALAQPSSLLLLYPLVHPVLPPFHTELAGKVASLSPLASFAPEILTPLIENYLGAPLAEATAYAMPGLGDLAGLPATLVINAEYDALRASGEQFAQDLRHAGVDVDLQLAPGVAHGHLNLPWLAATSDSLDTMASWVKGARS